MLASLNVRHALVVAAASLVLGGIAACDSQPSLRSIRYDLHASDIVNTPELPTGALTDASGAPYTIAENAPGRLTFLYFGFTYCQDVCPLTMAVLGNALDQLTPEERARTLPVFVSLDPPRDTPERIGEWLQAFGDDFVGLVGTEEEVHAALGEMGYTMPPFTPPDSGNYMVPHPSTLFVATPDGVVRFGYGPEALPEDVADDARSLLSIPW